MRKNTVQTKQWLDKCYRESSPMRQMVEELIDEFKRGRTSTTDAERSGRPSAVATPEIIEKVHNIVLDDPKVKVRELAEAAGISFGSLVKILHELTVKWGPRLLTIDQKGHYFVIQRVVSTFLTVI